LQVQNQPDKNSTILRIFGQIILSYNKWRNIVQTLRCFVQKNALFGIAFVFVSVINFFINHFNKFFIMNRIMLSVALVLGLGITQARAQVEQAAELQAENPKEQGVVGKIIDDLKESTRAVHEINKQNLAAEKAAFRARHQEAVEPDPGFEKFKEAIGLKNKMAEVAENFRESCRENSEKAKVSREQIRSHETYRLNLEEQRAKREAMISRGQKG
jgi:hypothetical protein